MKRISILSILSILLFCLKSFSYSVPAWAWTHTFNGTVRAVEYAGNYFYTAGTYSDSAFVFDNTTLPNNGSKDIFIAKWDSSGNMIWAKSVWGSAYDSVVSIKVNSNNELILSGSSNSAVLHADAITVNSNGGYDMFIAKYDLNGNALNAYFYGTAGNEYSIDMCVDYLNNIYVASANKLTQYNNSGVQVWQKSLTATQGNYVGHVIYSTFDSTVILTGTYAGSFTLNAVTLNTLFMLSWNYWPQKIYYAKINPNSNLVWLKDDGIDNHAQHTPNIFAKASNGYIYTAYQQFGGLGGTYYAFREQLPNGNMTNAAFGGLPVAGQGYDNDDISIIAVSGNASYVSVSTDNSFDGQTLLIYNVVNHTVEKIYNVFTRSPHIFRSKTAIYTPSAAANYSWGKISHDSLLGAPTYQNVTVCNGNNQTLTGNIGGGVPPLTYSWLPVTGLNNTNTNTVSFTATTNISYTLTVTDQLGQVAKDTFSIDVQNPIPPANITSQFPLLCDTMELYTNNGIPGSWYYVIGNNLYPPPGQFGGNGLIQTIIQPGRYMYRAHNSCGWRYDSIDVAAVLATVTANVTDDTICEGQSVIFNGSGALSYTWTNGVTDNVPFTPAYTPYLLNYIVTGSDANGCLGKDTIGVRVFQNVNVTNNLSICANQTPYVWNGQNLDSTGVYTANFTSVNGCDSIATLNLTVSPCIVCVPNFTINYSPFYNSLTESQSWIISSGTVLIEAGTNVKLDANANSYVTLNPGFKADSGSVFVAQAYNGCTAGAPQLPQLGKIVNPDLNATADEIVLYPNPTNGIIHIRHDEKLTGIQIFDMVGRLIINQKCNGETETNIDLSNLPNGVYHVKAAGYNSVKVVKNN